MRGVQVDFANIVALVWPINGVIILCIQLLMEEKPSVRKSGQTFMSVRITWRRARTRSFSGNVYLMPYR